jgi:hypothetical protein
MPYEELKGRPRGGFISSKQNRPGKTRGRLCTSALHKDCRKKE